MSELVPLSPVRAALEAATDVAEIKVIHDKAEALRQYCIKQGLLKEKAECAEVKLRAERRGGELLPTVIQAPGYPQMSHDGTSSLKDLGLSRNQSSRWQQIAWLPESMFEEYLSRRLAAWVKGKEPTAAELLKLVKKLRKELAVAKPGRWELLTGDFREVLADIPAGTVDLILTDPPYPREYLPLYADLSEHAARLLRPGALCAVMCGQSYLPELHRLLGEHLIYRWAIAYLTPGGQSVQVWPRKVNSFWKPVLLYTNDESDEETRWLGDVARSKTNDNDKLDHHWGQSESGMADLVDRLSEPDQLVCDPFAGAGTTGVAAVAAGRHFIGAELDDTKAKQARERLAAAT